MMNTNILNKNPLMFFDRAVNACLLYTSTNTWNIVMGVFDMAQSVVAQAAGIIGSDASIDISSVMTDLEPVSYTHLDVYKRQPYRQYRLPKASRRWLSVSGRQTMRE